MDINQETIDKIINSFGQVKLQIEKIDGVIEDLKTCKSDYTKTILVSAISKMSEQIGLKEKIFG